MATGGHGQEWHTVLSDPGGGCGVSHGALALRSPGAASVSEAYSTICIHDHITRPHWGHCSPGVHMETQWLTLSEGRTAFKGWALGQDSRLLDANTGPAFSCQEMASLHSSPLITPHHHLPRCRED